MATEQTSANQTQAAQAEEGLEYEALSAYAAQTGVAMQDEQSELRASLSATEPSEVATTPPKDATATSESLSVEIAMAEAESAVHEYFQLLNRDLYAEAWSRLTPRFQQVFSSANFASYQGFWQTVDEVAVVESASQEVNTEATEVTLIVRLRFIQGAFDWDRTYEYTLERTSASDPWNIADTLLIVG